MTHDGDNLALERRLRAVTPRQPWPDLIGLGGRFGSGKDALADFLTEEHGYAKVGMSDILNDALATVDPLIDTYSGWTTDEYAGWEQDQYGDAPIDRYVPYSHLRSLVGYTEAKRVPEVRRLLQALGTEVGRNMLGENTWTDAIGKRIQALRLDGTPVVLTGVRYPNELRMVKDLRGRTAWVDRSQLGGSEVLEAIDQAIQEPKKILTTSQHSSETSLVMSHFDIHVPNHGTLDDLREQASIIVALGRAPEA